MKTKKDFHFHQTRWQFNLLFYFIFWSSVKSHINIQKKFSKHVFWPWFSPVFLFKYLNDRNDEEIILNCLIRNFNFYDAGREICKSYLICIIICESGLGGIFIGATDWQKKIIKKSPFFIKCLLMYFSTGFEPAPQCNSASIYFTFH
jgi:hypothetical protein